MTSEHIESKKREDGEEAVSRRNAVGGMGKWGIRAAAASLTSVGLLGVVEKAYAAHRTPDTILQILNFALLLEYLEGRFYTLGVTSGVIPPQFRDVFEQIEEHENSHVNYLKAVINQLGGDPIPNPADPATPTSFDYTVNGAFQPFTDFTDFRIIAQGFEDTGVRAYKGQAANLAEETPPSGISDGFILTQALRVHSVEARHAALTRRINGFYAGDGVPPKAWIVGNDSPFNALDPVYDLGDNGPGFTPLQENEPVDLEADEANTTHFPGVDVSTFTSDNVNLDMASATAAFDEPLSAPEVLLIVDQFVDGVDLDGDGMPG